MDTSIETLPENKVRLHVAVPAAEFDKALDAAFRKLAREVRIPGFRPGKAPRKLLEARLGTEVARDQALRDAVPEYYRDALVTEALDAIAPPEIEITAGEEDGDVEFDAVVELRPVVELEDYRNLTVTLDDYEAPGDEALDNQVESLRERFADLEESDAPLTDDDYAQIDIKGFSDGEVVDGLTATDFLYAVGSDSVVPELDVELHGKRPGDILEFTATLPDRFGEREGDEVSFQVLVKEAKKKVLPEPTDEWVSEVTEFETFEELRADLRNRLEMVAKMRARMAMRERVLEVASDLVPVLPPEPLVRSEMERRLHEFAHQLENQGGNIPGYLEATGQSQEELLAVIRAGAEKAVLADLALRAVVAQEGIEASEEDVDAEIAKLAEQVKEKPQKVRRQLEQRGALDALRSDLARGSAMQLLIDGADVIDGDGSPIDLSLPDEDINTGEPGTDTPDAELEAPEATAAEEEPEA
ncbi:MAG: trigger factor [Acidimicrobiia bacterium]